jgi:hypothetical protein
MSASRGNRAERRARLRTEDKARGSVILLKMRPALFFAVREEAKEHGLSMPVYILALLHSLYFPDDRIFDMKPDDIRRKVRG